MMVGDIILPRFADTLTTADEMENLIDNEQVDIPLSLLILSPV